MLANGHCSRLPAKSADDRQALKINFTLVLDRFWASPLTFESSLVEQNVGPKLAEHLSLSLLNIWTHYSFNLIQDTIMAPKSPKEFSVDEVGMWLTAIGLGSKISEFKDNSIDGLMLVTLEDNDLQSDLGLSNLQLRKFRASLDFSTSLAASHGDGGPDQSAQIAALQQENTQLKAKIADLNAIINALQGGQPQTRAPAPAPQPTTAAHHAPPPKGHPVVAGAAGGAARGAMLGAIGGAIAGDPGKGAKMGAAMGAAGGGMNGLAARRVARRNAW